MLNRKKSFGEVHGHAAYAFEQDGKFFNSQGYQVSESGELIEKMPPAEASPLDMLKIAVPEKDIDAVIQEDTSSSEPEEKDARTQVTELAESMTVEAIKAKLDAFGVTYDKKALKADLVAMLVDEELAD